MKEVWQRATGTASAGQFLPLHPPRVKAILEALEAQRIEVAFRREARRRSLLQNAKLHVLASAIADETGESLLRTKRLATLEALGIEDGIVEETLLGQRLRDVRPTSTLSRRECSLVIDKLLDQCRFLELKPPRDEDVEVIA